MKDYLEYVRGSTRYSSEFKPGHFEWREDVPDGMEVSTFSPVATQASDGTGATEVYTAAVGSDAVQS